MFLIFLVMLCVVDINVFDVVVDVDIVVNDVEDADSVIVDVVVNIVVDVVVDAGWCWKAPP